MMIYPELHALSETLESNSFSLYCHSIAHSASEEGYVIAIDEFERSNKKRDHALII